MSAKPDPFWIARIAAGHPARLRDPGESVEDYRIAMGWDKPKDADRITELARENERLALRLIDLTGENNTLAGILRDVQPVIETIVPENDDEAQRLFDLRVAIAHAVDPYKREGTLL